MIFLQENAHYTFYDVEGVRVVGIFKLRKVRNFSKSTAQIFVSYVIGGTRSRVVTNAPQRATAIAIFVNNPHLISSHIVLR